MKRLINAIADKLSDIQDIRKQYETTRKKSSHTNTSQSKSSSREGEMVVDVSYKTVIKIIFIFALFLAAQQIFFQLQSILTIAAICFFLAMGLSPVLTIIESLKVPRPLAIFILYLVFFGALGILFVKIIPIIADQLLAIAVDLRSFILSNGADVPYLKSALEKVGADFDPAAIQAWLTQNLEVISKNLQSAAGSAFGVMSDIFKGVFNFIFALVLLFYILMEREELGRFVLSLFPSKDRDYIAEKSVTIQNKMAEWFKAQIVLMVSVGAFMYVGMKILEWTVGMQYAATIGLLAGFMELFPYIGVMVTGILASLVALNISWLVFFAVLVWIVITQFLEGNVLVPVIMEKVVGLSSVTTLLAVASGGILGNAIGGVPLSILGMILAIPVAASISIFVEEYVRKRR